MRWINLNFSSFVSVGRNLAIQNVCQSFVLYCICILDWFISIPYCLSSFSIYSSFRQSASCWNIVKQLCSFSSLRFSNHAFFMFFPKIKLSTWLYCMWFCTLFGLISMTSNHVNIYEMQLNHQNIIIIYYHEPSESFEIYF